MPPIFSQQTPLITSHAHTCLCHCTGKGLSAVSSCPAEWYICARTTFISDDKATDRKADRVHWQSVDRIAILCQSTLPAAKILSVHRLVCNSFEIPLGKIIELSLSFFLSLFLSKCWEVPPWQRLPSLQDTYYDEWQHFEIFHVTSWESYAHVVQWTLIAPLSGKIKVRVTQCDQLSLRDHSICCKRNVTNILSWRRHCGTFSSLETCQLDLSLPQLSRRRQRDSEYTSRRWRNVNYHFYYHCIHSHFQYWPANKACSLSTPVTACSV